jgi:hypothetical protein
MRSAPEWRFLHLLAEALHGIPFHLTFTDEVQVFVRSSLFHEHDREVLDIMHNIGRYFVLQLFCIAWCDHLDYMNCIQ